MASAEDSKEETPPSYEYDVVEPTGPKQTVKIEFEAEKRHDIVEIYGSWHGLGDINDPAGEMKYASGDIYFIEVELHPGTYYYRFLIDEEDWETSNYASKTALRGDEYNVLEVGTESSPSPPTKAAAEEEVGTSVVMEAGGLVVTREPKKRGRGSMDLMDVPDSLVEDARKAGGEEKETPEAREARSARRRRRIRRPFASRGASPAMDVDFQALLKKKEEEMARMLYTHKLRAEQAFQEELNTMKDIWKTEREVRMSASKKLKTKNKEMKKELADVKAEVDKLKKLQTVTVEGEKKMTSTLEDSMKAKSAELEKLRADITALRDEVTKEREGRADESKSARAAAADWEAERKRLSGEVSRLESDRAALEKQNALLLSNMDSMKSGSDKTMEQHTARLDTLRSGWEEEKAGLLKSREELKQLKVDFAEKESELRAEKEARSTSETTCTQEKTRVATLTEKVASLEKEITTLSATSKATGDEAKAIAAIKMSLESEKGALADKCKTLEARIDTQKGDFEAELKNVREQAKADLDSLAKSSGDEASARMEEMRKEIEARDEELRALRDDKTKVEDALKEAEANAATLKVSLDAASAELTELKATRDALEAEVAELKSKLSATETELADAKAAAEAGDTVSKEKIATLTEQLTALKASSSDANTQNEAKIAELEAQAEKLRGDVDCGNEEKVKLTGELTEAKAEIETLKTSEDTLKTRVTSLEEQLKQEGEASAEKLAAKVAEIDAITTDLGDKLSKKEGDLSKCEADLADVRGQFDAKVKEFLDAETTIGQLKAELESAEGALGRQKDDYEAQLDEFREKDSKLVAACSAIGERVKVVKADLATVRTEKIDEMEKMDKFFPDFKEMMGKAFSLNQSLIDDLMAKYKRELTLRRKYFNDLQDLRGNIRVFCRIRPLLGKEKDRGYGECISFPQEGMIHIIDASTSVKHQFEFDRVYNPESTQADVSADTTEYVQSVMDGYNVSIFAYGQTGSGKTYTMNGPTDNPGVNSRALKFLFELAKQREPMFEYKIKVSMLEVYNEEIRDLLRLVSAKTKKERKELEKKKIVHKVRHLPDGTVEVSDLTWETVATDEDISRLQAEADSCRSMASTDMNAHSSRSHMVVIVDVDGFNHAANIQYLGKLYLVDLAGSEKLDKSKVEGDAKKEAIAINKSLTALGNVMEALQKGSSHIPYRDSKLTDLMSNSLGGNAKTVMFINACPTAEHATETINSLRFAEKVAKVELGAAKASTSKGKKKKSKKSKK
jgi:kinesin family protein C2/C3